MSHPSSAANVVYDAQGNITQEIVGTSTMNYKYDAENRLVEVLNGSTSVATYTYDVLGRRIRKNVNGGADTGYLYDLAGRPIVETDGSGNYVRGEVFLGGRHLATYSANNTHFVYTNWMGTERVRTTYTDSLAQVCDWGDYGNSPSCTDANNSSTAADSISAHGYAGYEYDKESDLHHMWFRYYNPRLGRFMTTDPYGGSMDIGDPQSMNRYAYVGGNPTNFFDPLGLDCRPVLITRGGANPCPNPNPPNPNDRSRPQGGGPPNRGDDLPGSHNLGFEGNVLIDELNWIIDFNTAFWDGVYSGGKKPNETKLECVLRNANETTLGGHEKLVTVVATTLPATAAAATQVRNINQAVGGGATVQLSFVIGTYAGIATAHVTNSAAVGTAVAGGTWFVIDAVGLVGAVAGAAEVGLLAGSLLNCR